MMRLRRAAATQRWRTQKWRIVTRVSACWRPGGPGPGRPRLPRTGSPPGQWSAGEAEQRAAGEAGKLGRSWRRSRRASRRCPCSGTGAAAAGRGWMTTATARAATRAGGDGPQLARGGARGCRAFNKLLCCTQQAQQASASGPQSAPNPHALQSLTRIGMNDVVGLAGSSSMVASGFCLLTAMCNVVVQHELMMCRWGSRV